MLQLSILTLFSKMCLDEQSVDVKVEEEGHHHCMTVISTGSWVLMFQNWNQILLC